MEMYTVAFDSLQFNEALAIASFLLVLNAVIALAFFGISRRFDLGN